MKDGAFEQQLSDLATGENHRGLKFPGARRSVHTEEFTPLQVEAQQPQS